VASDSTVPRRRRIRTPSKDERRRRAEHEEVVELDSAAHETGQRPSRRLFRRPSGGLLLITPGFLRESLKWFWRLRIHPARRKVPRHAVGIGVIPVMSSKAVSPGVRPQAAIEDAAPI
jgi:hypothetical protein